MALAGTHVACASAMLDAERAVGLAKRAVVEARGTAMKKEEQEQLQLDVRAAGLAVLFAHIVANHSTVTGVATGAMAGGPGVPVTGTVT